MIAIHLKFYTHNITVFIDKNEARLSIVCIFDVDSVMLY